MSIKYKLVLIRKEFNGANIVKIVSLKSIQPILKIEKKTFSVNIEKPSLIQSNSRYFFVDIDTNSQIFLTEQPANLNSDELDMIVSTKIIKEITAGAIDNFRDKIVNILIGAAIGGMLAAVILLTYMNSKIDEIYTEAMQLNQNVIISKVGLQFLKMIC